MYMEETTNPGFNVKKYVKENKEKLLSFHKSFFESIDKIKSYEETIGDIILKSDTFFNDTDNVAKSINLNAILMFIMAEKMKSAFKSPFTNK